MIVDILFTDTDKLSIRAIEKEVAIKTAVKKHYLHKKPHTPLFTFGLYYNKKYIGCCIYSVPVGSKVTQSISRLLNNGEVIELSRLYIDDGYGQNIESWFIGQSFKILRGIKNIKCVVSYADTNVGHIGIIYQATNFLYNPTGRKAGVVKLQIGSEVWHNLRCKRKFGTIAVGKLEKITGKKVKRINQKKKHRYLYFVCNRKEKRNYLKELKHPILSYPKKEEIK